MFGYVIVHLDGARYGHRLTKVQSAELRRARSWSKQQRLLKEMFQTPQKVQIAYHEAGHAVAAMVLGIPIKYLTLARTVDTAGVLGWDLSCEDPVPEQRLKAWGKKHMVVYFAGFAAERRFSSSSTFAGIQGDFRQAVRLARLIARSSRQLQALLKAADTRAKTIIEGNWPAVSRVARALANDGSLLEHELYTLNYCRRKTTYA